jgi:hypothetical protein
LQQDRRRNKFVFLALIPKEKGAVNFGRFRPISLCNTSYKILTKIIANRIKKILPVIIPENQGGFVKGRHIVDNIILVQEALHSSIRRKDKGMIIKLDLANAFDRVRHNFLFKVMENFGFAPAFINWIKACIGSPWIAPLVNVVQLSSFKPLEVFGKAAPSLLFFMPSRPQFSASNWIIARCITTFLA